MFAIEAMASGKITICNIRNDFFELYEMKKLINQEEFPIVNANYKNLKIILKSLLDNRSNWNEISTKSRKFVEKSFTRKIGLLFDKINKKIESPKWILEEKLPINRWCWFNRFTHFRSTIKGGCSKSNNF